MAIKDTLPPLKPTLLLDFANTKALDPRVTFTRASTATYYDGKTTAKAEENLFYPSVNIGTPYQNAANALTNNVGTAPDGTATASLLVPTAAAVRHYCSSPLGPAAPAGTVMTGSVHVKAAGYGFAFVMLAGSIGTGGSRYGVTVNLSTGAVGGYSAASNVSGQSVVVTNVGGGWFRVALSAMLSVAPTQPVVYVQSMPTDGATYQNGGDFLPVYSGNGVDGAYFWGFQLEQRDTVTSYTPTTTAPITNYIPALQTAPAGVPRFYHNPLTGESLGLLIEESRTNLLTYSEQFDNAVWAKTGATVQTNAAVAPDGAVTAEKLVESAVGGAHVAVQNSNLVSGVIYTLSIHMEAGERKKCRLQASSLGAYLDIDLTPGAISVGGGVGYVSSEVNLVGNGVYRASLTFTESTTGLRGHAIYIRNAEGAVSYTGDGFSGIYIWGAQLEAGSFATSYIPTAASAVTRAADSASMTGANFSSWYRADEGTLYAEANAKSSGALIEANNGASSERLAISIDGPNSRLAAVDANAGTYYAIFYSAAGSAPVNASNKGAFAYRVNDFAMSANATTVATDTSGVVGNPTQLRIGSSGLGATGEYVNGTIKRLAYYPKRLTNAQLQSLTA